MAQYSRPSSDITIPSGVAPYPSGAFYSCIDEATYNDTDYFEHSALLASSNSYSSYVILGLSEVETPRQGSVDVHYRAYIRPYQSGNTAGIKIQLYQGATLIAGWEHTTTSTSAVTTGYTQTLTAEQIASITDWGDLRLYAAFKRTYRNIDGAKYGISRLTWFELEAPDKASNVGLEMGCTF